MDDGNLTLKEFWKLPESERRVRFQELSDHDRFGVRQGMNPGVRRSNCSKCIHYLGFLKCEAFEEEIPREHRVKVDKNPNTPCGKGFRFEEKSSHFQEKAKP